MTQNEVQEESEKYSEITVLGAKINKLCTEASRNADMVDKERLDKVDYEITSEVTDKDCERYLSNIRTYGVKFTPADIARSFNELKESYFDDLQGSRCKVPVNEALVERADNFLMRAQSAGYTTLKDLAELLDIPTLNDLAIVNGQKGDRTNFQAMLDTIIFRGENNFIHRKNKNLLKQDVKGFPKETPKPLPPGLGGSR